MTMNRFLCAVLATQLTMASSALADTVSHWTMDGARGDIVAVGATVADAVGSNDGLVINDTLKQVFGPVESPSALLFQSDGNTNKIDVPDDTSLHFNLDEDDFTLETVFRVADGATGRPSPFAKNGSSAQDSQYWSRVRADQTGGVQFLIRADGGDGPGGVIPPEHGGTTSGSVTDGKWHHFAVVYEAGSTEMDLYLDHVLDTTITVDPSEGIIGANADGLIIGGFTSSSREFDGSIADVRISNVALSEGDFLPIPTATIPEPGSLALFLLGMATMTLSRRRG